MKLVVAITLLAVMGPMWSIGVKLEKHQAGRRHDADDYDGSDDDVDSADYVNSDDWKEFVAEKYSSKFEKKAYPMSDPKHPGGHREVYFGEDGNMLVTGRDQDGEAEWQLKGRFEKNSKDVDEEEDQVDSASVEEDIEGTVFVDFSSKGGPKGLLAGKLTDEGITWPDGNAWKFTPRPEAIVGEYKDENLCPRKVEMRGSSTVILTGADQADGAEDCLGGTFGTEFQIQGYLDGSVVHMDFSSKGGPKDLTGEVMTWDSKGWAAINWQDGNTYWGQQHRRQLDGKFPYITDEEHKDDIFDNIISYCQYDELAYTFKDRLDCLERAHEKCWEFPDANIEKCDRKTFRTWSQMQKWPRRKAEMDSEDGPKDFFDTCRWEMEDMPTFNPDGTPPGLAKKVCAGMYWDKYLRSRTTPYFKNPVMGFRCQKKVAEKGQKWFGMCSKWAAREAFHFCMDHTDREECRAKFQDAKDRTWKTKLEKMMDKVEVLNSGY